MTQPEYDLTLDSSGNIAMATIPYSYAQDAASAIRTFLGECYYNTALGVPYFQQILGKRPPIELMRAQFIAAAMTVPGVVAAQVFFSDFVDRKVSGQVQVTDRAGAITAAGF